MILSADTASEKCKLLSKKHREYFVYSRAFLQRRWHAAAAEAVLKPAGRELCEVALHYYIYCKGLRGKMQGFCLEPLCTASILLVHKSFAIYPIDILHHRATILAVERIEC